MKIYKIIVGELSTNCYVVASCKNNAFIIDPGDDIERIRQVLEKNKLEAKFSINTHGHIDHIKANAELKLPVYAHEYDCSMIGDPEKNLMSTFFGSFEGVAVSKILKDGDMIELDELSFKVIHTPGHTQGCICLLGHGVLFSGDTLFKHGIGRTDFPGASDKAMQESLKKLALLDPKIICYPGHGPETTIGSEL
jgi:hydroxyacylglutathione hydrolase